MQISFLSRELAQDKTNYVGHDTLVLRPKKMRGWPREYQTVNDAQDVKVEGCQEAERLVLTVKGNLKGHCANRTLSVTHLTPTYSFHCHYTKQSNYFSLPKIDTWKRKRQPSISKGKGGHPRGQLLPPPRGGFSGAFRWPLCVSIGLLLFYPPHFWRYSRLPLVPRWSLKKHLKTKQRAGLYRSGCNASGNEWRTLFNWSKYSLCLSKQRWKMKILIQYINKQLRGHNANL